MSTAGGLAYGFDPDGNLTTAGGDSFSYDAAGHLTAASVGGKQASYRYDGDGLRVATTAGGVTTPYVLDRAGSLPVVLAASGHGYTRTPDGALVVDGSGSAASFPLADAPGSTRLLTDGTGAVTGTTAYDAFGRVSSATGGQSAFGYTGALSDIGGLVDLNAREYDTATGRFLQADSYETGGPGTTGYNRYTYAVDNPTTITDPTGHFGTLADTSEAMGVQNTLLGIGAGAGLAVWLLENKDSLVHAFSEAESAVREAVRPRKPDMDCAAKAEEASLGLAATAQELRGSIPRSVLGGNIASAAYCIDGVFGTLEAQSGNAQGLPAMVAVRDPGFTYNPLPGESTPRYNDAEAKILEEVASFTNLASNGDLYLYTERDMCVSCDMILAQFRLFRPGIAILVEEGGLDPRGRSY